MKNKQYVHIKKESINPLIKIPASIYNDHLITAHFHGNILIDESTVDIDVSKELFVFLMDDEDIYNKFIENTNKIIEKYLFEMATEKIIMNINNELNKMFYV